MTSDIITTDRLVLRSAKESDLDSLYRIAFSVPEVMAHAFGGKPFSREKSAEFFARFFDHETNGKQLGVLTLKDTGTIIGFAGLLECSALGKQNYEIGFILGVEFWGNGYASEIGHAQIEYGSGIVGCNRLLAVVSQNNKASLSVLHKIGMAYHSTIETNNRGIRDIYIVQKRT